MDPLVAAVHHNLTLSPLCRLPGKIPVKIVSNVDDYADMECLRRVSRCFLQLVPKVHDLQHERLSSKDRSTFPILAERLRKDMYCQDCWVAEARHDWSKRVQGMTKEYLHCSGCQSDHPACLFSPQQRQTVDKHKRICIGHEGFLRLCRHKTVRWANIVDQGRGGCNTYTYPWTMKTLMACDHPDHLIQHGRKKPYYTLYDGRRVSKHPTVSMLYYTRPTTPVTLLGGLLSLLAAAWRAATTPNRRPRPPPPGGGIRPLPDKIEEEKASAVVAPDSQKWTAGWHVSSVVVEGYRRREEKKKRSPGGAGAGTGARTYAHVTFMRQIPVVNDDDPWWHMDPSWYNALAPESYNLVEDEEGLWVYWCLEPRCRNHWRDTPVFHYE
ncbi:hypothetical protein B0H63DRAFT_450007 [Podospora didyma]|uniref:F-box domain-containing protein n=1 Tax=Podospora didyma TaxID=330526 RepID=A0AAE0NQU5_9PEZI|nr:hypothetical protein B0H63DRAFT_450007 [Podospora didyma]